MFWLENKEATSFVIDDVASMIGNLVGCGLGWNSAKNKKEFDVCVRERKRYFIFSPFLPDLILFFFLYSILKISILGIFVIYWKIGVKNKWWKIERMNKRTSFRKTNNKGSKELRKFVDLLSTHPKHLFIEVENQNINYS